VEIRTWTEFRFRTGTHRGASAPRCGLESNEASASGETRCVPDISEFRLRERWNHRDEVGDCQDPDWSNIVASEQNPERARPRSSFLGVLRVRARHRARPPFRGDKRVGTPCVPYELGGSASPRAWYGKAFDDSERTRILQSLAFRARKERRAFPLALPPRSSLTLVSCRPWREDALDSQRSEAEGGGSHPVRSWLLWAVAKTRNSSRKSCGVLACEGASAVALSFSCRGATRCARRRETRGGSA
jgi:hypothetical protein